MATNKHALIRYKLLDKCFSNKWKKYFIADLIAYCTSELSAYVGSETKVSRRQLLDDITFMRSEAGYQAPIVSMKEGKRVYYRYGSVDFSILKQPLNPAEQEQIQQTLETLGRIKGMPQLEWLNTVQAKLSSGLKLDQQKRSVISFEDNEFLKGLEYLEPLYQNIIHSQVISINYQGFKQAEPMDYIIHPYFLKQYNNRWFLFGCNEENGQIQNLALDRIRDVQPLETITYRNSQIDFDDYFYDIVGVTNLVDQLTVEVVLKFKPNRLPYVLSKPIHGSQRYKNGLIYLDLKLNRELESIVLSFGNDVEVIAPVTFRDSIEEIVRELFQRYSFSRS
ncbi:MULTISPECIES: helix-turn-helix transcriptional regulator [Sphingobacterium]|uniref:helix-turn-helix transcriptional regulator n=1 Tax=Sphingobacterium TaxID=28453 RepID=UPI001051E333|nr:MULTISPECIES: WYL domain-containing protein [Sphingobacterium]MCW2258611.1 putative DNA-binding transcriptional regulator YafY [Sphingobacterium kitahiroshimense]TCR14932.1 putative DNA-binding transcriptional regulator YafY [Sphingobacterium sp. JUb78]